jgi:hypothetical protein
MDSVVKSQGKRNVFKDNLWISKSQFKAWTAEELTFPV